MASARLKISEEAMDAAKSSYDDCVEKMKQLRKNLKKAVEEIRSGWDSDGGKEWYKNFNDYIAVMEHMSENIQKAKNKYQPLFEEADKLELR